MKIEQARMAALAVAGLWTPSPQVIQWMIVGGEITSQVFDEIETAMLGAFGRTDRQANVSLDDPTAARKFAILAAAEAARMWGGYSPSVRYAALAYALSKYPYVQDESDASHREVLATQFVAAICSQLQEGDVFNKIVPGSTG